jgi:hypothetical protein
MDKERNGYITVATIKKMKGNHLSCFGDDVTKSEEKHLPKRMMNINQEGWRIGGLCETEYKRDISNVMTTYRRGTHTALTPNELGQGKEEEETSMVWLDLQGSVYQPLML